MKNVILGTFLLTAVFAAEAQFDRNFVGVAFSPYTDNLPGRLWDQYSVEDIKAALRTVGLQFSSLSTYSMGIGSYNKGKPWDQCDSNALVPRAAAQLNNEGPVRFTVNIGVFQDGLEEADRQREVDNAYAAAGEANAISPGTVWGVTYTNEYITDAGRASEVLGLITRNKGRDGLKVGMRTERCQYVTDGGQIGDIMREIVRNSDFIYCNVYASPQHAQLGPAQAAQEVVNYFNGLRESIRQINGNIDVQIGETGWPSEGNSFNDSENTVTNLIQYWESFARLASGNGIKVKMFQAIDEPWKAESSQFKAEGKYGWWYKPNNGENRFIEKKTGK